MGVTVALRGPWFAEGGRRHQGQIAFDGDPAFTRMFNKWIARYQSFTRERYQAASRGDGTWPPLAQSTLLARAYRLSRTTRQKSPGYGKRTKVGRAAAGGWTATAKRQFAQGMMNAAILRDTGLLFNALDINAPGNVVRNEGPTVEYGIGGPAGHAGGTATIGESAAAHQSGGVHGGATLPQRKILVAPPEAVIDAMVGDARQALNEIFGRL